MPRMVIGIVMAIAMGLFPALSASAADDIAAQKQAMIKNLRQKTIALHDGRFLIFSGIPAEREYAYSVDLVRLEKGTPHFDPLFVEEYDQHSNSVALSNGVGFAAQHYHFDPATNILDYTSVDMEDGQKLQYKYRLDGDTLTLQEVLAQNKGGIPNTLYKAIEKPADNAQTH